MSTPLDLESLGLVHKFMGNVLCQAGTHVGQEFSGIRLPVCNRFSFGQEDWLHMVLSIFQIGYRVLISDM